MQAKSLHDGLEGGMSGRPGGDLLRRLPVLRNERGNNEPGAHNYQKGGGKSGRPKELGGAAPDLADHLTSPMGVASTLLTTQRFPLPCLITVYVVSYEAFKGPSSVLPASLTET